MMADKINAAKPFGTTAAYETSLAFSRGPIDLRAGTDYFVSPTPYQKTLSTILGPEIYLPTTVLLKTAFAHSLSLSTGDAKRIWATTVFAIRLDTTTHWHSLFAMSVKKEGRGCSSRRLWVWGAFIIRKSGCAKYPNNFQLIYLAFPFKKTPVAC